MNMFAGCSGRTRLELGASIQMRSPNHRDRVQGYTDVEAALHTSPDYDLHTPRHVHQRACHSLVLDQRRIRVDCKFCFSQVPAGIVLVVDLGNQSPKSIDAVL